MKEFREAHAHATGNGRNKFMVPVLLGDTNIREMDQELKLHLENHTYIEFKNVVSSDVVRSI